MPGRVFCYCSISPVQPSKTQFTAPSEGTYLPSFEARKKLPIYRKMEYGRWTMHAASFHVDDARDEARDRAVKAADALLGGDPLKFVQSEKKARRDVLGQKRHVQLVL